MVLSDNSPEFLAVVSRLREAGCVFAHDEAMLLTQASNNPAELELLVAQRADGLPLEHLLGWVEFAGIRLSVDPGVGIASLGIFLCRV